VSCETTLTEIFARASNASRDHANHYPGFVSRVTSGLPNRPRATLRSQEIPEKPRQAHAGIRHCGSSPEPSESRFALGNRKGGKTGIIGQ
jgi:hypothetical protein